MAILAIFYGDGINQEMYDALRNEVGWENQYPNGAIVHVASFDEAGNAHVADVWSSPDALNEFVGTRLAPAMQKLNIPQPSVDVYPVHNINAYKAMQKHVLS
jgi:hypothetical protein